MCDSNLYILKFHDKEYFKVGKADNLHNRFKSLRHLGKIDFSKSYHIKLPMKDVFRLEKSIHFLLDEYRYNACKLGDGETELFTVECYNLAMQQIEQLCKIKKYVINHIKPTNNKIKVVKPCSEKAESRKYERYLLGKVKSSIRFLCSIKDKIQLSIWETEKSFYIVTKGTALFHIGLKYWRIPLYGYGRHAVGDHGTTSKINNEAISWIELNKFPPDVQEVMKTDDSVSGDYGKVLIQFHKWLTENKRDDLNIASQLKRFARMQIPAIFYGLGMKLRCSDEDYDQ